MSGHPVVARPRRFVVGTGSHGDIGAQHRSDTVAGMEDRVDVVRRYLASFSTGDAEVIAALVTDDFRNEHLSELGSGCVGRDEYRSRLAGFLGAFVDARYTIVAVGALGLAGGEPSTDDAFADGEVVARYRFEAECEGIQIDIPGMMWFEVRSGQIARRTDLWDSLTFLRQTGQAG